MTNCLPKGVACRSKRDSRECDREDPDRAKPQDLHACVRGPAGSPESEYTAREQH
jgi:hypothetical protein